MPLSFSLHPFPCVACHPVAFALLEWGRRDIPYSHIIPLPSLVAAMPQSVRDPFYDIRPLRLLKFRSTVWRWTRWTDWLTVWWVVFTVRGQLPGHSDARTPVLSTDDGGTRTLFWPGHADELQPNSRPKSTRTLSDGLLCCSAKVSQRRHSHHTGRHPRRWTLSLCCCRQCWTSYFKNY